MNKYFIQLFQQESTVIIPDLGALTMTDESTGEIMFLPYLKFDDGKLAGFIAATEGVDEAEAKNTVSKFVREIQAKLDQGESFDIFEFGSFSKNADGEIEFRSDANTTGSSQSEAVETSKEHDIESIAETPEKIATEEPIEVETEMPEVDMSALIEEVNETDQKEDSKPIVEAEKESTPPPAEATETATDSKSLLDAMLEDSFDEEMHTELPKVEEEKKVVAEVKPTTEATSKSETKEAPKKDKKKKANEQEREALALARKKEKIEENVLVEKKEKKKRGFAFYFLLFLVALILGGGTWGYLNYDMLKEHLPFLQDKTASADAKDKSDLEEMKELMGEELTPEEAGASEEKKTVQPKEIVQSKAEPEVKKPIESKPEVSQPKEPKVAPSSGKGNTSGAYSIIVGSFSNTENAKALVAKLKAEGHPASAITNSNNSTAVAIASFNSINEAREYLTSIRDNYTNGWIKKN